MPEVSENMSENNDMIRKKQESSTRRQDAEYGGPRSTIGPNLNFSATEAYKRLRTNLLFSFAGEPGCRVIGVTSSLRGEGKTTTSCNIAYTLAEMGKRVLLIDADMRLPNVYKSLNIRRSPGLSNLLTGVNSNDSLVQYSGIHEKLSVITSGDIPPNPSELLASKRMSDSIELLKKEFDYIVIDLPPVDAVTDALIVAKLTDGMVLVARQSYVDKPSLDNTLRQMRFQNINIIGFVLNYAEEEGGYYRRRYYKKKGYYSDYGYGEKKTASAASKTEK